MPVGILRSSAGDGGGAAVIQTVAVGTDGSGTATRAVDVALDLAARYGARIVFISAYVAVDVHRLEREARDAPEEIQWTINPAEDVDATLRECEERAAERGLTWVSEAREGDPAKVVVELAEHHGADLLVIGNRGMQRRLLGSVPNTVSHRAPCSVLIVKTT
jgi:nucleotide-binding universal stress UspA family protein